MQRQYVSGQLSWYLSGGLSGGDSAVFEDLPIVLSLSLSLRSPEGSHKPIIFSCVLHYLSLLWRGMLNLNEWDWACHLCAACTSPFWLSRLDFSSRIVQETTSLYRSRVKRSVSVQCLQLQSKDNEWHRRKVIVHLYPVDEELLFFSSNDPWVFVHESLRWQVLNKAWHSADLSQ